MRWRQRAGHLRKTRMSPLAKNPGASAPALPTKDHQRQPPSHTCRDFLQGLRRCPTGLSRPTPQELHVTAAPFKINPQKLEIFSLGPLVPRLRFVLSNWFVLGDFLAFILSHWPEGKVSYTMSVTMSVTMLVTMS